MALMILLRKNGDAAIVWVLLLLALICIVPLIIAAARQAKRRKALRRFAGEVGFSYSEAADFPDSLRAAQPDLFSKGYRLTGKVKNVLQGQVDGVEVLIFDYYYRESLGSNVQRSASQMTRATVACFRKGQSAQPLIRYEKGFGYLAPERYRSFLDEGLKAYRRNGGA